MKEQVIQELRTETFLLREKSCREGGCLHGLCPGEHSTEFLGKKE